MRSHPTFQGTLRWCGILLTALLGIAWIVSARWCIEWHDGTLNEFVIQNGCARSTIEVGPSASTSTMNGWYFWRLPPGGTFQWRPRYQHSAYPSAISPAANCHIFNATLPLWIPLMMFGLPTAAAWRSHTLARRRERSSGANRCPKCGYDRSGLMPDAVCPECGTAPSTPHGPSHL